MKMRASLIVGVSLFAATVQAEVTKLGEHSLGQSLAKSKFAKGTLYGCQGSFRQELDKGKVSGVEFTSSGKCKAADVEAAVKKEMGGEPIVSTDKTAKLWEGKTGSMIVMSGTTGTVVVKLVTPGPGAKRVCFAEDGFTAFWKSFKDNLGKADAAAAMFKFPIKDFDDKIVAKDAKALAKKWPSMIDDEDKKEIASGALVPTCELATANYNLRLGGSNLSFEAKQVGGKWMWVEINSEASG
jgi:hypothetical protein